MRLLSVDLRDKVAFSLEEPIAQDARKRWSNYPRGVLRMLQDAGVALVGMDIAYTGDVPRGSGLSSSAAVEVAIATAAQALGGFEMSDVDLVRLCQRAENEFVGTQCGVMDQFISRLGREAHALFLDCRSLAYRHVPLSLGDHRVLVCHSGVKHSLVTSAYNERRAQCERGVAALTARHPHVKALRDVTPELLEESRDRLDPVVYRRCRHVVSENARVRESVAALERGDLAAFGRHMSASHDSLRDDYEVSCPEVDLLVELARSVPGVLGARITGGGFGGCTVNLVAGDAAERFREEVVSAYRARTGIAAVVYTTTAAAGAGVVAL